MLNLTEEKIGPCVLAIQVEIEPEKVSSAMQQAARRIAQKTRIPGFRPGKAPYHVVLSVFGKESVLNEAVSQLGDEILKDIVEQRNLKLYTQPELEVAQEEPLKLKYTLTTQPHVDLGGYRTIRVPAQPPEPVTDEAVNHQLELIRKRHSTQVPVDRPAQAGDALQLDLKAETSDPQQIWYDRQNIERELISGDSDFAPGFSEGMVGAQMGETRNLDLSIPADHSNAELAGKTLKVTATVHDVREVQLPPLDDELAKTSGEYETLEALRNEIRNNLEAQAKEHEEVRFSSEALQAALKATNFEYPDAMVDAQVDNQINDLAREITQQGFQFEQWLEMNKTSLAALRVQYRSSAEENIKRSLLLYKVAESEGIKVDDNDVNQAIAEDLALYPEDMRAELQNMYAKDAARVSVSLQMVQQRALDKLVAIAKGEGILLPGDAAAAIQGGQILVASQ